MRTSAFSACRAWRCAHHWGLASTVDDVERFLAFVEMTYRDRAVGTGGLAARRGC